MNRSSKWAGVISHGGIILLMIMSFWLQHNWLGHYAAYVEDANSEHVKFRDKFLTLQETGKPELQAELVDKFVDTEERANEHFLEGTRTLFKGFDFVYMATLGLSAIGSFVFWQKGRIQ